MTTIPSIFALVYLGMILGGLPFLQLDRTGVALLGAIALLVTHSITMEQAEQAVHVPTLILLFSFMVLAAQLRLGGFYDWVTWKLGALQLSPSAFLGGLVLLVGILAAVFSNDVVCLSMAPVLIDVCLRRNLNPVPFLLGLACAANIGSAATLIGNPQNMLIGARLQLDFDGYLAQAALPVLAGLGLTWWVIRTRWRNRWVSPVTLTGGVDAQGPANAHALDRWHALKGLGMAAVLFGLFLGADAPRELLALGAAGILLLSRKLHSHKILGMVDWQVLLLFIGLFIVNAALDQTGLPKEVVAHLAGQGIDLHQPGWLLVVTFALSNLVSNVPAVMLLLPHTEPSQGVLLALASTLAGNLLIVGSIANIIVVDAAARRQIEISWLDHARVGVPVTLLTLGVSTIWLIA
jgi:Na+/H+ antiporter NhaD/arsenite permease-like protein